ncbi:MAG TPA: (2Fe-2S)-binding protein [Vicinamibacteria bacterium]|nr:(2Fe-2S)-binding protein [Vicinamibacteria bacterium]
MRYSLARDNRKGKAMARVKELRVNRARIGVDAEEGETLLRVLREQVDVTGVKYGCGEGQCGACTVLIDGAPVRSCLTRVEAAIEKEITTIEGLERDGRLHPLQQSFLDAQALQCGYCTPGMILAGVGLLNQNPRPTRDEILRAMEGNICRCGTYPRILAAIENVAGESTEQDR